MTMRSTTYALPFAAALLLGGCNVSFTAGDDATKADAETSAGEAATAAAPSDADKAAAEAAIREVYAPYNNEDTTGQSAAWQRPVFSRELTALIATIPHPEGEIGPLDDADWFCGCQDWDAATAGIKSLTTTVGEDGRLRVASSFAAMADAEPTNITYVMVKEGDKWLIDDMITIGTNGSLRADIAALPNEEAAN